MAHFVYPAANPQPAAAYPTVQTAYVAAAPQAAYAAAAAPRAAGAYEGYQATPATPQYAYTTRTQVAVTVSLNIVTLYVESNRSIDFIARSIILIKFQTVT